MPRMPSLQQRSHEAFAAAVEQARRSALPLPNVKKAWVWRQDWGRVGAVFAVATLAVAVFIAIPALPSVDDFITAAFLGAAITLVLDRFKALSRLTVLYDRDAPVP